MVLPVAAVLLALAVGQSDGSRDRRAGDGTAAPAAQTPGQAPAQAPATEETRPAAATTDFTGPPGVPYMPTVGPPGGAASGVFLGVALLSEVRVRTLAVTDAATTWGTDLEVTPGIALEVGSPRFSLSLGYAPRLTVPFDVGSLELAVLNRATLRSAWRAGELWTVTALGLFVVGDYSQLIPASTPGGVGPPPPVLNPVRSFQTYPYVGIDTLLRVEGDLSPRTRLRVAGGYFDVGGTGTVGEAIQPRAWGPQGEGSFAWDASRNATLTTTAAGQDWIMSGREYFFIATITEGWRQSWTAELDTTVLAGAGLSNREVESRTAAGKVVPVAGLRLDYHPESPQALRLILDLALSPFFDTYARIPYQRFTIGGSLDWRPSDAWQVGASLSAAIAPYTVRAPESYGTAGLSASYSPVSFLVLSIGGFGQAQFQGPTAGGGAFRQWTAYFSLGLRDRISL